MTESTNNAPVPTGNEPLVHQPATGAGYGDMTGPGFVPAREPALPADSQVAADPMAGADAPDPVAEMPADSQPDTPPRQVVRTDNPHVRQDFPVFEELKDPWNDNAITLTVPGEQSGVLEETLEGFSKGEQASLSRDEKWIAHAGIGIHHQPRLDMFDKLSEREKSDWRQVIKHGERVLGITKPKIGDADNAILRGEAAMLRARAYMGLGGQYRVPLWNSGFWVTVVTPGDEAILELDRKLAEEKIALGRATSGLLFSNASVFIVDHVVQFVMNHLVSSTLKDSSRENLLKWLTIHDIQHLAWGMACAIWPNGFQYARAVLGATPAQNKVVEGKINVSKLQWIDYGSLTEWQIKHMANITIGSMTNEEMERYQKEFTIRSERQIKVNDNVRLNLHVPSVEAHLLSGQKWVNNIVTMTNRVFGMDQDDDERNAYVTNQGKATMLRQYGHWVKSVELGDAQVVDVEDIEDQLSLYSSDDAARDLIMNEVIKYAEDTTAAFIAVPTVDEREELRYPRMPHLLPIDALTAFFTLLRQKLPQILAR